MCGMHYKRMAARGTLDKFITPVTPCSVKGCEKPSKARALCATHITRFYRSGSTEFPRRYTEEERRARRKASQKRVWKNYYNKRWPELRANVREWKRSNAPKVSANNRQWRESNRDVVRTHQANRGARERNGAGRLPRGFIPKLFALQKGRCVVCRTKLGNGYHIDHILPLARGGQHQGDNIQLLCAACNLSKHAKHPVEFMQQRGFLL